MKDLCPAGELLAQRMEIGVKNLQEGSADIKDACSEVATMLQDIRNTVTDVDARLTGVEHRTDNIEISTLKLSQRFENHVGQHTGIDNAILASGRKYGVIYGFVGAMSASFATFIVLWQMIPK